MIHLRHLFSRTSQSRDLWVRSHYFGCDCQGRNLWVWTHYFGCDCQDCPWIFMPLLFLCLYMSSLWGCSLGSRNTLWAFPSEVFVHNPLSAFTRHPLYKLQQHGKKLCSCILQTQGMLQTVHLAAINWHIWMWIVSLDRGCLFCTPGYLRVRDW